MTYNSLQCSLTNAFLLYPMLHLSPCCGTNTHLHQHTYTIQYTSIHPRTKCVTFLKKVPIWIVPHVMGPIHINTHIQYTSIHPRTRCVKFLKKVSIWELKQKWELAPSVLSSNFPMALNYWVNDPILLSSLPAAMATILAQIKNVNASIARDSERYTTEVPYI